MRSDANGIPVVIEATTDRRAALKDARYIVNCVRVGGLEGFETDIEIPLKYGGSVCWRYIVYWWYYVRTTSNRGNAGFCKKIFVKYQNRNHAELFESECYGNMEVVTSTVLKLLVFAMEKFMEKCR